MKQRSAISSRVGNPVQIPLPFQKLVLNLLNANVAIIKKSIK